MILRMPQASAFRSGISLSIKMFFQCTSLDVELHTYALLVELTCL